jgi:riboflavin kinase/FMN adenylyltransferase
MKSLYRVRGKVRKGKQRGRGLGYPTANINLHTAIPDGIYAGSVRIAGKTYHAAVFVGAAETFNEKKRYIESYIFQFQDTIYDSWMTVYLYKKIRGNKKFSSTQELVEQIKKDVLDIQTFFGSFV